MQIIATCPKCFRVSVPKPYKPTMADVEVYEYAWQCSDCKREYSASINLLKESDVPQTKSRFETYNEKGDRIPWPIEKKTTS